MQDFSVKTYATPAKLESIDGGAAHVDDCMVAFGVWLLSAVVMTFSRGQVPATAHTGLPRGPG